MHDTAQPPVHPLAVSAFLRQLADDPSSEGSPSYAYAMSVILPGTRWPQDAFMERLLKDLHEPFTRRAVEQAEVKIFSGDPAPFSFTLTAADGGRAHFLALPRVIASSGAEPVVALALAAHPAAAQRPAHPFGGENALFKLLDVLPAYVLLIDRDHGVRYSNRIARQLFGKMQGKQCYEALRDRDAPCPQCAPFSVFSANAIKVHDWVSAKTNTAFRAHSYPFETVDGKECILQVGINITEGIRARHALDISEQRYRSIAENLTMGLALVDSKLTVVTLNPRMREWFGSVAAKGASIRDILPNPLCDCVFDDLLADGKTHETEFRLPLSTAEERQFRLVACPMLTRSKRLRAGVILLEDVTERRTMAARLQQMQRIEALGSLAGGIAHEINQPLSALHLYVSGLQMLLEKGGDTPRERVMERLALVLAQADRIQQIISHMRALVMQNEIPQFTPVSVADAVDGAFKLVGAQLRDHGIAVAVDIPDGLPRVDANDVQLEQVIINLLVNAMHALDTVSDRIKTIRIFAEPADGMVHLRVSDNGPGVGDLRIRIFDPFFTTKEERHGMGLGLSIVHALVTSWGGRIEAGDNSGAPGALFTVSLPVSTARPSDANDPQCPPLSREQD